MLNVQQRKEAEKNARRTAEQRRRENAQRKNRIKCEEYDTSSPFPPTEEQVHQCGQNIGNSIAAFFAQQAPVSEISYALVVAKELRLFSKPILDFTMHQFRQECCVNLIWDVNLSKEAAK